MLVQHGTLQRGNVEVTPSVVCGVFTHRRCFVRAFGSSTLGAKLVEKKTTLEWLRDGRNGEEEEVRPWQGGRG